MQKLGPRSADILNLCRPRNNHRIPRSAKVRRHLLYPLKRRIACPSPPDWIVRFWLWAADLVDVLQIVRNRRLKPIEILDFVERSLHSSFRTRSIVPDDVNDHGVVCVWELMNRVDQTSGFVIGE